MTVDRVTRVERVLVALSRVWCGFWRQHDRVTHFEDGRMFLRCVTCGAETPGWRVANERRAA